MPEIVVVGLGPGNPQLLTLKARNMLWHTDKIYARTRLHPVLDVLPDTVQVISFDHVYHQANTFEEVYRQIVDILLQKAAEEEQVIYAVPGHPMIAETTTHWLRDEAAKRNIELRIVEGMSFIEPVLKALGKDLIPHTSVIDALELGQWYVPPFPPNTPALVLQLYDRDIASRVKLTLMSLYPDEHPVILVHRASLPDEKVERLALYQMDRSRDIGIMTALYVPPLAHETAFEAFQNVVARLRAPDGCPWDREQTHQSLRPYLLEEAYEVLYALDTNDPQALKEELGDLLLQILMHAQIAAEHGEFTTADVLAEVHRKMVRRHPHVFGDEKVKTARDVLRRWEQRKRAERGKGHDLDVEALLDPADMQLPALAKAQKIQRKLADWGVDIPKDIIWEKVYEELEELKRARDPHARTKELGDVLFALVNLARMLDVDAESALRERVHNFLKRYQYMQRKAREQGRSLTELSEAELDELWEQAKKEGL